MKKTRQHHGGNGGGIPLRGIRKSNNIKKNKSLSSSVELITASDRRFRSKVLASVGLDDDDDDDDDYDENDINNDDDASYDKCDDIEEATASLRQKHHDNDKRMRKKKKKNKNKSENSELINDDENDTDEDCEEYESFDQSTSSSHRCSKLKPICHNLLWIIATIAAVIFILYDDEKLEQSEVDEDVILKDQPYSYNGYKDARIPDDDVAQFGGGILYNNNNNENGASSALPSNSEEEEEEGNELVNQVEVTNHHEPSGIVEVDILWEQLDGYAEMSEPLEENDLPVFWHIPKCGGTTLQDMMSHCFGMIEANEVGRPNVKDELEIVKLDNGNRYVNVDMSNPDGIAHAKELGFGSSGLANVVITSWFHDTASVFDNDHKGRCFVLLRHPIRRAVSMFYYLKDATWENTYSEAYKNMDIEEYATSQYAEDNWMTRFLTNEMNGGVYDRHLDLAKEVLESKCLVGIMEDFTASIKRFDQYFGWNKIDFGGPVSMMDRGGCVARVIQQPDNAHPHPSYEEGGEVWNLLLEKNKYDLALYEYARHLFYDVQVEIVS